MPKLATGLPRGRPPKNGHAPSIVAAAPDVLAGKRPKFRPGAPPDEVKCTWDADAIRAEWDSVHNPQPGPAHRRPSGVDPTLVRMVCPAGQSVVGPGITRHRDDPDAIFVPHDWINDMHVHGYRIEH